MKKLFLSALCTLCGIQMMLTSFNSLPAMALSVPQPDYLPATYQSEENTDDSRDYYLNTLIPRAMNMVIAILGLLGFFGILIAGINMLIAFGNEDKIKRAKTNIQYGVTGYIVLMLAYAIVSIMLSFVLPNEAEAIDVENDIEILLPSQYEFIQRHDEDNRVMFPSGDLVTEIFPAIIVNIFYMIAFLVFIAITTAAGMLIVGRGNEEFLNKAKSIIIYSAMAMGFMALGYALMFGIATFNLNENAGTEADDLFIDTNQNETLVP